MALGSTQLLVKLSTRNLSWGKGGRCLRLKPHHLYVPNDMEYGRLNLLEPSGPHWACYGTALPLHICRNDLRKSVSFGIALNKFHKSISWIREYLQRLKSRHVPFSN
jgi:hypothetical protein